MHKFYGTGRALNYCIGVFELAEEIREYIDENFVKPARKRGDKELVLVSGEVHDRMGLRQRLHWSAVF